MIFPANLFIRFRGFYLHGLRHIYPKMQRILFISALQTILYHPEAGIIIALNKLRILRHSPEVLQALRDGDLTERHARALLKLRTEEEKLLAIGVIIRQNMSVARAEKYISLLLEASEPKSQPVNVGAFLNGLSQSLARIQSSGIPAISERRETEDQIVLTITIPKS